MSYRLYTSFDRIKLAAVIMNLYKSPRLSKTDDYFRKMSGTQIVGDRGKGLVCHERWQLYF